MSRKIKTRAAVLLVACGLIAALICVSTVPTHRITGSSTTPTGPVRGVPTSPLDGGPTTTPPGPAGPQRSFPTSLTANPIGVEPIIPDAVFEAEKAAGPGALSADQQRTRERWAAWWRERASVA